jgi:acetyl-CoA carboxylase biotin carboxylase subunit
LRKILVANRGEIAVRIIRACREMGLATVAVYSACDRAARHVRMADEAYAIGESPATESYLRIDRLVAAGREAGADAVHPGYGFLAENEDFATACADAGLTFIGPSASVIAQMGSKTAARTTAMNAGVPVVPGTETPFDASASEADIAAAADHIGYPVMVKAVAGGGGKGMRVVTSAAELSSAIRAARSEASASFGDAAIYLERRLIRPRHIEVQLLGDSHGTIVAFVERECSIQRRHQKVVEESPSPVVTPALRQALASAAVAVAREAGYTSAGTVEFLLDEDGRFYFLEVNTRLQVEHPVTELITGIDFVAWQLRIACGERLDIDSSAALTPRGHAIECRVYAEDPDAHFVPSPGRITSLRVPGGPGIRDDSGVEEGDEVPIYYDPLVSKLIAWGADRPEAIRRMSRALSEYEVGGIRTTLPFFRWLMTQDDFAHARFHTEYLDELLQQRASEPFSSVDLSVLEVAAMAAAIHAARPRRPAPVAPSGSSWARAARLDALRA